MVREKRKKNTAAPIALNFRNETIQMNEQTIATKEENEKKSSKK